jgi:hypothetical protein
MILFAITLQPAWIIALGVGAPLVHTLLIRSTRSTPAGP